jgi:hypothetical protein
MDETRSELRAQLKDLADTVQRLDKLLTGGRKLRGLDVARVAIDVDRFGRKLAKQVDRLGE